VTPRWVGDDAIYNHGGYRFTDARVAILPPFDAVEGRPLAGMLFPRVWPL